MALLKKEKFVKLADVHHAHCVSMYLPTHRSGHEVIEDVDRVTLKNQVKEAKEQLQQYGLQEQEIKNYMNPVQELLDDKNFWRHQSDGLAIFLYDDKCEYFTLPIAFTEFVYVSDHLYLKPLVPLLNTSERFFIMALSLGNVKFYEATSHSIVEVIMEGLVPQSLEEAHTVGQDYEQKSLQFRAGHNAEGEGTMYHGHGAGNQTEKKEESLKYFREINEGLMRMLHDEEAPLILACVDYLEPIYREANTYPHLFDRHISGNHENTNMLTLHNAARDILGDHFKKDKKARHEDYQEKVHKGLASYEEKKVIPAAIVGQVDTLFIRKDDHLWGVYDAEKHSIKTDNEKKINNACLLNKAAIETIKNSGKVFLMESEEMPQEETLVNATFRYQA
jgi:hypothetical protein